MGWRLRSQSGIVHQPEGLNLGHLIFNLLILFLSLRSFRLHWGREFLALLQFPGRPDLGNEYMLARPQKGCFGPKTPFIKGVCSLKGVVYPPLKGGFSPALIDRKSVV